MSLRFLFHGCEDGYWTQIWCFWFSSCFFESMSRFLNLKANDRLWSRKNFRFNFLVWVVLTNQVRARLRTKTWSTESWKPAGCHFTTIYLFISSCYSYVLVCGRLCRCLPKCCVCFSLLGCQLSGFSHLMPLKHLHLPPDVKLSSKDDWCVQRFKVTFPSQPASPLGSRFC